MKRASHALALLKIVIWILLSLECFSNLHTQEFVEAGEDFFEGGGLHVAHVGDAEGLALHLAVALVHREAFAAHELRHVVDVDVASVGDGGDSR